MPIVLHSTWPPPGWQHAAYCTERQDSDCPGWPLAAHRTDWPLPAFQVTLQDQVEVAGEDSEAITTFLESKVDHMIHKANSRAAGGRDVMLPLIRLRVSLHT